MNQLLLSQLQKVKTYLDLLKISYNIKNPYPTDLNFDYINEVVRTLKLPTGEITVTATPKSARTLGTNIASAAIQSFKDRINKQIKLIERSITEINNIIFDENPKEVDIIRRFNLLNSTSRSISEIIDKIEGGNDEIHTTFKEDLLPLRELLKDINNKESNFSWLLGQDSNLRPID